jgi:type III restriction enzyme
LPAALCEGRRLPAFYSPDFLVRTASGFSGGNQGAAAGHSPQRAAQTESGHRVVRAHQRLDARAPQGLPWHYVLLAENVVHEWQAKGAHLAELLDYARLRPLATPQRLMPPSCSVTN